MHRNVGPGALLPPRCQAGWLPVNPFPTLPWGAGRPLQAGCLVLGCLPVEMMLGSTRPGLPDEAEPRAEIRAGARQGFLRCDQQLWGCERPWSCGRSEVGTGFLSPVLFPNLAPV